MAPFTGAKMNVLNSLEANILNPDVEKQQQVAEQIRRKRVEAAIASALLPGAGQWLLRDYRAAYIFLALFLVPFCFFGWPWCHSIPCCDRYAYYFR